MPADRHFIADSIIDGQARGNSPVVLEEARVVAVADLPDDHRKGRLIGPVGSSQQEAGEGISGSVLVGRIGGLEPAEVVEAVGADSLREPYVSLPSLRWHTNYSDRLVELIAESPDTSLFTRYTCPTQYQRE